MPKDTVIESDIDLDAIDATVSTEVSMDSAVQHYLDNSKVRPNGLREISKGAYIEALDRHGVTKKMIDDVKRAEGFEATAAARVALADLEGKISEASPDDLKNDDFRRNLSSTVRVPTFGGSTEVTVYAEKSDNIPFRGEGDGPSFKLTHGRVRTTVNTKNFLDKDFPDEAKSRIMAALGVS